MALIKTVSPENAEGEMKEAYDMFMKNLVDALAHGVNMVDHSIMMQVFQMDQNCEAG